MSPDIVIVGAGPAGLCLARALSGHGLSIVVLERQAEQALAEPAFDGREIALTHGSQALLERLGLWARLPSKEVAVLRDAQVFNGPSLFALKIRAEQAGAERLGHLVANQAIRRAAYQAVRECADVQLLCETGVRAIEQNQGEMKLVLHDGQVLQPRLLVAADSRMSQTRQALGIGVRTFRYGQKALAFAVTHEVPHENVSTEIHRSGGPFTLVPLPDRGGKPCSAVIWMENGREVARLAALPSDVFAAELNARSAGVLGHLTLATRLSQWPIISQIAHRFTGPRTALIAEAAHVVPPIGAQGLNMSLADLSALLDLSGDEPGHPDGLAAYDRARRPEAYARLLGIDALNRASQASLRPLRDLRAAALGGLYGIAPVRRLMMRAGLGMR